MTVPAPDVDRLAAVVGLRLDPDHRAGVAEALGRLLAVGAVVVGTEVPDATEPAPVFEP
jgi:hypothetical protein